jgi:hypothetical protein
MDGLIAPAVIPEHTKRHKAVAARVPEHDFDEPDQRIAVGDHFFRLVGRMRFAVDRARAVAGDRHVGSATDVR